MKKYAYMILSAFVLTLGLQSCIDETGAGTPAPKKMYLQAPEYEVDLSLTETLTLRWIDVTNATYNVWLSNDANDKVLDVQNEMVSGDLGTMSMDIPYSQIAGYVAAAELAGEGVESLDINVNVKGTPVDPALETGLAPEGSTVTAVIHVTMPVSSDVEDGTDGEGNTEGEE